MKSFQVMKKIKCIASVVLFFCGGQSVAQSLFDGWDFDRAFYDSEDGNYILIHHKADFKPALFAYYDYTSVWEVSTGKLMNTLFEKYNQYKLKTGEQYVTYSDGGDWYDKIDTRIDPPKPNGTYLKLNNNSVEVYDAGTNVLKYVIHPADAFRKEDYSGNTANIKTYVTKLVEVQQAKGFSLITRFDTLLAPAKSQTLNLNRKPAQPLSDNTDCSFCILMPEDSLLAFSAIPTPGNESFIYIDSSLNTENGIAAYQLSYAGNIKDLQVILRYAYSTATMPVTVLLFSNPSGPVTAARKKQHDDSVAAASEAIRALATVRTAVKSKMLPGEKMVIDTAVLMNPGGYNQSVINAEFDEKLNRTLYVAVKEGAAAIEINTVYTYRFVELPDQSKTAYVINGYTIYRISFTGPVNAFDIVHDVEQSPATIYMFLTKRPDEKGYAASKKIVDEWNGAFAERDAELDAKRKEKDLQYAGFATIAGELKSRMQAIYESAKSNNAKLHASPKPSLTEIDAIIKDVESKYDNLKNYMISNESKITSVAAANSSYAAYIKNVMEAFMDIRGDLKRIDDTVVASNESGGNINIGNLWAAFLGIQQTAYRASELDY